MDGTCLECGPVKVVDSDEMYTYSFFEDILIVQVVDDIVLELQDTVHKLISEVENYLER
jgi:dynein heavy chain